MKKRPAKELAEHSVFVTPRRVAQVLGLTHRGVLLALAEGRLPGKKIAGRWYVFRKDFEALITPDHEAA
jgi:hypothetical protein